MINILLTGVGGQGTVLAAKVLAQAAQSKGWAVRTAETIGMAQRGGTVTSHVRMGDKGEAVHSPLIAPGTASVVIAFEPGEGARALPYLAPGATLITAKTPIQPVTSALSGQAYHGQAVLDAVARALACVDEAAVSAADDPGPAAGAAKAAGVAAAGAAKGAGVLAHAEAARGAGARPAEKRHLSVVDDKALLEEVGNRKALNTVLLAAAVASGALPLTAQDLKDALAKCVKPRFVEMNCNAVDAVVRALG